MLLASFALPVVCSADAAEWIQANEQVLLNIPLSQQGCGAGSEGFSFPLKDQRHGGVCFPVPFLGSLTAKEPWLFLFKKERGRKQMRPENAK